MLSEVKQAGWTAKDLTISIPSRKWESTKSSTLKILLFLNTALNSVHPKTLHISFSPSFVFQHILSREKVFQKIL